MSKTIKELFLFPNYKIIVFNTFHDHMYYTVKGSHVCYSNGNKSANSIESDFMNNRIDVSNYKMLGKLSELTEGHAMTVFKEARYGQSSYPNFMDIDGDKFMSSLVSLKSYLASEGWSFPEDKTWIIIPKPTKKLVGNKIDIEFEISNEKFDGYIKTLLPVYFSPIKSNTTEITYTVETPDYLYDFLTHHPETDKRPKSKIYTTNVFSSIITHIRDLSSNANNLRSADEDEKKAKKVILIRFSSSQKDQRDSYNFGYTGKQTGINYQYYIGYAVTENYSLVRMSKIRVDKRYESGKGFVKVPYTARKIAIGNCDDFKVLDWTQEREDFLNVIEVNFKKLSDNLNNYLSDLDADKLDLLITQGTKLLN